MSTASQAQQQLPKLHRTGLRQCLFLLLAVVLLQSPVWTQEKKLAAPSHPQVEGDEKLRSTGELPVVKPHEVGLSEAGFFLLEAACWDCDKLSFF